MGDFVPYDGPVVQAKPPSAGGFVPYDGPVVSAPKPIGAAMNIDRTQPTEPGVQEVRSPTEHALNALVHLPGSLWNDVAVPTARSIGGLFTGETERGLYRLGSELTAQTADPETIAATGAQHIVNPEAAEAATGARQAAANAPTPVLNAIVNDYAKRYGSLEEMEEHPGAVLMDLSMLSPLAGETALAKAGNVIDPLTQAGNALRIPANLGTAAARETLGFTTGTGGRQVSDIAKAGRELGSGIGKDEQTVANAQAVTSNMNQGAPGANIVGRAKGALAEARQARSDAYRTGMAGLNNDKGLDFVGQINEFAPRMGAIEDAVGKANEVATYKAGNSRVSVNPSALETQNALAQLVDDWKNLNPDAKVFKDVAPEDLTPANFHSVLGLDALKRIVGDIRDTTDAGSPSRVAADRVYNAVKAQIVKADPQYAQIMEGYEGASSKINEATKIFSLGEKASTDTALRKLLSATKDSTQTNFGERARVLDQMAEHDTTLPYAIAGQAMQSWVPRGVIARGGVMANVLTHGGLAALLHNPFAAAAAIPGLMAASPRIVGNAVYYGNRAVGSVEDVANALHITPDNLRNAYRAGYAAGEPNNALVQ